MKIEFFTRHPLRLLLYIEWILFAVVMALEVAPRDGQLLEPKWLNIGIVALVAVMGLRLPSGRVSIRVIYTIAQIIPILIAAAVGMRPVAWLYLIVVIRSYLIFGRQYRLWITGGIFALYLTTLNLFPSQRERSHVYKGSHRTESVASESQSSPTSRRNQPNQSERGGFRWGFVFLFGGALLSLQLLVDRILAEKLAKEEPEEIKYVYRFI